MTGDLVRFSGDPREGRAPARLEGVLSLPSGAGPFPALVMLHGCTGLRTGTGAIQGKLRFWAGHLRELGYATLMVDSFTPRGIDEVCTGRHMLSPVRDRADDARGALRYLQGRSDIRPDRIGLLGWSNGAAGAPITIKVYPDAHHSFDAPDTPGRYRPEVKNHNRLDGDCGATVGTDPAARADSIAEVTRFLAAQITAPR